jgi:hypothetical protein
MRMRRHSSAICSETGFAAALILTIGVFASAPARSQQPPGPTKGPTDTLQAAANPGQEPSRAQLETPIAVTTLAVPADSSRWSLQGKAQHETFLGRSCLMLDGGAAVLDGVVLRDAVIDVDVATPASRGFFGIQFRIAPDGGNAEWIYLRQHKSGLPDAIQYTPVLNTGLNWQLYSGPGFTNAVDIPRNEWFHLRLEIAGAQGRLFVKDMTTPALVIDDLKSGLERGEVALASLAGATCYANFEVRALPDAPWARHLPPMPAGTLTHWQISPALDALARDPERLPTREESARMRWDDVDAEPPGLVVLYRHRQAPHPRVTFANDWTKRLERQQGAKILYARTTIDSPRAEVRKLALGYSDEVSVFLNGRILYRGRSAQYFRDPGFLGIVDAENDAVYLPLRKGRNELVLAIAELGGGWGFVARLGPSWPERGAGATAGLGARIAPSHRNFP